MAPSLASEDVPIPTKPSCTEEEERDIILEKRLRGLRVFFNFDEAYLNQDHLSQAQEHEDSLVSKELELYRQSAVRTK